VSQSHEISEFQRRHFIDFPSALVAALAIFGPLIVFWCQIRGMIAWPIGLLLGILFCNLSFTGWHEASHGNLSRYRWFNSLVGILVSFVTIYPGYFGRRREHLAHHKWEGDAAHDPVVPRVLGTGAFSFILNLARSLVHRTPSSSIPERFLRLTILQRICDRTSSIISISLLSVLAWNGHFVAVLCVFVVPRAVIFFFHAFYICFLPHSSHVGDYQLFRVRRLGFWFDLLTMGQSYHGVHHRWPFVPWHRYKRFFSSLDSESLKSFNIR
jgi:beta-carotene hydroxylase